MTRYKAQYDRKYVGNNIKRLREQLPPLKSTKLKKPRANRHMTQAEFANALSDYMGMPSEKRYGVPAISAWESGRKLPPIETLSKIAEFFHMSLEELCRPCDNTYIKDRIDDINNPSVINPDTYIVRPADLGAYHKKPIYVHYNGMQYNDEWGIVDILNKRIMFIDNEPLDISNRSELSRQYVFYAIAPYGSVEVQYRIDKPLTPPQVIKYKKVWVSHCSHDPYVKGRYDGWYHINRTETCLINSRGDILPLEGMNYSFNCYLENIHM